jgi:polysaccharide biosynthesis protein PslA
LEFHSRYRVHFVGTLPVLSFWQRPIRDFDLLLKKALDLALSLAAMIILSPILLITAIAIKVESRGDILFKQRRYGFNNREIFVYKFRSMYSDRGDADGAVRTQIINVFCGEMSIVGPRPHATQMRVEDEFYFDAVKGYMARHRVKPGITGWAQVRGLRGEIQTLERAKKRVEYDKYYIDNWSILLDLRIILLTVFIVIWDRDAY